MDDIQTQTGRNVCRDSLVTHYLLLCHAALHLLLRRDTSHLLEEEEEEEEDEEEGEGFCSENEKSRVFSIRFLLSLKAPPTARLPSTPPTLMLFLMSFL